MLGEGDSEEDRWEHNAGRRGPFSLCVLHVFSKARGEGHKLCNDMDARTLSVVAILLAAGCGGRPTRLAYEGPAWNPTAQARRAIELHDRNGDGVIDAEELEKCPALKAASIIADRNRDGRLDQMELMARLSLFRDCRSYLVNTVCSVVANGRPLEGATVRFVPDEAIAGIIQPAVGVTDSLGKAAMKVEGRSQPGVQLGFYTVELSKTDAAGDETVEAAYGGQSQFSYEAAPDGGVERLTPRFELK